MSIVQLTSFDIATANPWQFLATSGFWASLPRLTEGLPSARLLMIADTLDATQVAAGFQAAAVPEEQLAGGIWFYRTQYDDYLAQAVEDVRYIRLYLVVNARMGEQGLCDLLASYGVGARPLDHRVPLPFEQGLDEWSQIQAENGYWGLLRSKDLQFGGIYPRSLHRLFGVNFPVWAALQVGAYSEQEARKQLRLKSAVARYAPAKTPEAIQEAGEMLGTVARLRAEMNRAGAALHTLRFYVLAGGSTAAELATRLELVRGALPFDAGIVRPAGETVRKVFSAKPYALQGGALLTSPGLALLTGSALSYRRRTETRGVLIGTDSNQGPVVLDIFNPKHASYNMVVLGQTGSGKTFAVLLMMLRHLFMGVRLIIIDPQGNVDLSWLGQEVYHKAVIGTSQAAVNILDIVQDEIGVQIENVFAMLAMLGVYDRQDAMARALLDEVLLDIYEPIWGQNLPAPTLKAVQQRLRLLADSTRLPVMRDAALLMEYRLNPYTVGSYATLFSQSTTVEFGLQRAVTVYDISRLPTQSSGGNLRAALLSILVGNINQSIRRLRRGGDTTPILFFVDEMGVLMRDEILADHISYEYKTARSRRVGMIVADQDLHTLLGPRNERGVHPGETMLFNAASTLLFYQKDSERELIQEKFSGLPEMLFEALFRLPRGVCIAQLPDDLLLTSIKPNEFEKIALSSQLHDRQRAQAVVQSVMKNF